MPRETVTIVVELPDRDGVRDFVGKLSALEGQYRLKAEPSRLSLSEKQRGYYHGHVVEVLAGWLERGKQPLPVGKDGRQLPSYHAYAHAYLKLKCLSIPVFNRRGDLKGHVTGSTEELDTLGMHKYTERCRSYLWDTFRLYTDDPDPEWASKAMEKAEEPAEAGV